MLSEYCKTHFTVLPRILTRIITAHMNFLKQVSVTAIKCKRVKELNLGAGDFTSD